MNRPQSVSLITSISRALAISTEDAIAVLDRAGDEIPYPFTGTPARLEAIARLHWDALRFERSQGGGS